MSPNPTTLQPLSASQISTYMGCQRRWAFEYLEGKRPPPHPSAALGSEIHRQLEEWLKNKVRPSSSVAAVGMNHAPPPGIGVVEERIAFATPNSLWRGAIDLHYDLIHEKLAVNPFTTGHTVIHDWKTSGNARYNKTSTDLATDPQANLYAFWAFGKGAQRVEGRWVYLATKGAPNASPVAVSFEKSRVGDEVGKLDLVAKECQSLYQIRPKSSELAANLASCEKYGGCPHASYCDRKGASIVTDNSDFMAFINSRAAGVVAPPPPPPAPPVVAAPPAPPAPPPPAVPAPVVPVMDEETQLVYDYALKTLKLEPEAALRFIRGANPVPSEPSEPVVEAGFINPPEAKGLKPLAEPPVVPVPPAAAPKSVAVADQLEGMDRDQLKKIAVFLGVMDQSNRFGEPKIRQLIRGVQGWETKIQDMGKLSAPVTVPETVQSEFEETMRAVVTPPPVVSLLREPSAPVNVENAPADLPVGLKEPSTLSPEAREQQKAALREAIEDGEKSPVAESFSLEKAVQRFRDTPREDSPKELVMKYADEIVKDDDRLRTIVREEVRAALQEFFSRLNG